MREPRFWARDVDPRSREAAPFLRFLLSPIAYIYGAVTRHKIRTTTPRKVRAKVICVGNLTAGGVGKSPVVARLRKHIEATYKLRVATLSRGYGGKLKGPLQVSLDQHSAEDVGDEPLMLASQGESWIGADRAAAGQAMSEDGVDVIIMDDGHQNPGLRKDLSLVVVDAQAGFGNGFVIPKGPLRERVADGLERADAIIIVGDGTPPEALKEAARPTLRAAITAIQTPTPGAYVAFAGIGRPEKFFDTLNTLSVDVKDAVPFPDHHRYSDADLRYLKRLAGDHSARLITTEKDAARLPVAFRNEVVTLPIEIQFDDRAPLDSLIEDVVKPASNEQS